MAVVSIKNKLRRGNLLVGNDPYIPTDFESIATVTVGSGGSSSISFTSIPSTYTHLQLRFIARGTSTLARAAIRLNSDSNANYSLHYLYGDGSSAGAGGTGAQGQIDVTTIPTSSQTSNTFGSAVVDILDYANTNKNKTIRSLGGDDLNGSGGYSILYSGAWYNTNAVNTLTVVPGTVGSGDFAQYSHFALYGIKVAS